MWKVVALAAVLMGLLIAVCGCEDADRARQTLEDYGFTDINVGGYDAWSCGDDYTFSNSFEATNANRRRVKGTVCCGYLKGCTVKF